VKEYFPFLIDNVQKLNVYCSVYSKQKSDSKFEYNNDEIICTSNLLNKNNFDYPQEKLCTKNRNGFSLQIDSTNEFPFVAKSILKNIIQHQGNIVLTKSTFKLQNITNEIQSIISVDENTLNNNLAYSGNSSTNFILKNDSTLDVYAEYFAGYSYTLASDKAVLSSYIWNNKRVNCKLINYQIKSINFWQRRWTFWE
jgi:hypothetical protein